MTRWIQHNFLSYTTMNEENGNLTRICKKCSFQLMRYTIVFLAFSPCMPKVC